MGAAKSIAPYTGTKAGHSPPDDGFVGQFHEFYLKELTFQVK
jgi:hypothetical protein